MRQLTSLMGNSQRLDGGAMFGNAPKALWTRWAAADDLNRIDLATRCLLVQEDGRNLLFETGVGSFFPPKLKERFGVLEEEHVLLHSLAAKGLTDADIDIVVLSHLHFDHAGGLLSSWQEGQAAQLLFPNAQYVIGEQAWERAQAPHFRDRASFVPEMIALLKASDRLQLVTGAECDALGPDYRFHLSHGHTPGMILGEISMPAGPVVFAADLIPGAAWVHLPITMGYDRYPEKVIDEKEALLTDLVTRQGRLFYTHDPDVALSSVSQDERGRFTAMGALSEVKALAQ